MTVNDILRRATSMASLNQRCCSSAKALASWREDEFKAFNEAVEKHHWQYDVICFSFVTKQVAIKIK